MFQHTNFAEEFAEFSRCSGCVGHIAVAIKTVVFTLVADTIVVVSADTIAVLVAVVAVAVVAGDMAVVPVGPGLAVSCSGFEALY